MTYPRQVTARLIDTDATTIVSGDPLATAFGHTWLDEKNGPGLGKISIPLASAGAAEVTPGRFVQFLVEGTPRFTFAVEGDPELLPIEETEEHGQSMRVQGRNWVAAMMDKIIIEPSTFTLDIDTSWRLYSFASPDFPNAGSWVAAEEMYEYLEGTSYPNSVSPYRAPVAPDTLRYPAPIGYPFPLSLNIYDALSPPGADYVPTYWIWPPGEELTVGHAFFRRSITIAEDTLLTVTVTGDNYFTLFLEGIPLLGEKTLVGIWKFWKDGEIVMPAGTYQFAAVVQNPDWDLGPNPGGFLFNLFTLDNGQQPLDSFLVSDDSWVTFFTEDDIWPGWTPGQILDSIITEGTGRGALSEFGGGTFTDTDDSDSVPWQDAQTGSPYIPSFAADVGSTLLDAAGKMVDEGHIDWHGRADAPELDAWSQGQHGSASGVVLAAGTNLRGLQYGPTTVYANALLVQWDRGYVWVTDAAAIAADGRLEDLYSTDAATETEAIRLGNVELQQRAAGGWPAIIAVVEPTSSADCPYEGFDLCDTLDVADSEDVEVLSITCEIDGEGYAIWTCEINKRWQNVQRQDYDLFRDIGGRSGKGYGVVS